MAKSKYEYVKQFERDEPLLPNCFAVVRVDGRGFHKYAIDHLAVFDVFRTRSVCGSPSNYAVKVGFVLCADVCVTIFVICA